MIRYQPRARIVVEQVPERWVTFRAIKYLQPATTKAALVVPPPIDLSKMIACTFCHATVTQPCRRPSGHTTTPHEGRVVPRLCPCGSSLAPRRRYCDPCAVKMHRESKRDHLRRKRAAVAA